MSERRIILLNESEPGIAVPEIFRKPDGTYTEDAEEYMAVWKDMSKQLSAVLKCKVTAFDPGFDIHAAEDPTMGAHLPAWVALRLTEQAETTYTLPESKPKKKKGKKKKKKSKK